MVAPRRVLRWDRARASDRLVAPLSAVIAPPAILTHFADRQPVQPESFRTALNNPHDQPAWRSIVWLKRMR